jgi:hypothetical protein
MGAGVSYQPGMVKKEPEVMGQFFVIDPHRNILGHPWFISAPAASLVP